MAFSESFDELKKIINELINETKELRDEVGMLKIEIREMKQNMKPTDKKVDKDRIKGEMTRIGKKHVETEGYYEPGSMDDRFRKEILPIILEQEKEFEKYAEERGKNKKDDE